jgi:hypothetical protein
MYEIPVGVRFSTTIQNEPGAHPASYTMGTGSSPGLKWQGRAWQQPTTHHLPPRLKKEYNYTTIGFGTRQVNINILYHIIHSYLKKKGCPAPPLWTELPISRAFRYIYPRVPSKGASIQVPPTEQPRRCSIARAFLQIPLRVPGTRNQYRFSMGPPG